MAKKDDKPTVIEEVKETIEVIIYPPNPPIKK